MTVPRHTVMIVDALQASIDAARGDSYPMTVPRRLKSHEYALLFNAMPADLEKRTFYSLLPDSFYNYVYLYIGYIHIFYSILYNYYY